MNVQVVWMAVPTGGVVADKDIGLLGSGNVAYLFSDGADRLGAKSLCFLGVQS
jgi:hypothetical protein